MTIKAWEDFKANNEKIDEILANMSSINSKNELIDLVIENYQKACLLGQALSLASIIYIIQTGGGIDNIKMFINESFRRNKELADCTNEHLAIIFSDLERFTNTN